MRPLPGITVYITVVISIDAILSQLYHHIWRL